MQDFRALALLLHNQPINTTALPATKFAGPSRIEKKNCQYATSNPFKKHCVKVYECLYMCAY